jgi:hypothetical protein
MDQFLAMLQARDWEGLGLTLLAGIGGVLATLTQSVQNGKPTNRKEVAVQFCTSAFVGYLIYGLCLAMGVSGLWLGPIVGTFGWLGAVATIQVLRRFVFNKLGIPHEDDK